MAGFHGFPPAAMAFATSASTCSRLSADRLVTTSVVVASLISPTMKSRKRSYSMSMTNALSATTMHAVLSSENSGLNVKPSSEKNASESSSFLTGRFTTIALIYPPLTSRRDCWTLSGAESGARAGGPPGHFSGQHSCALIHQ